jgi:hypothetical protein
MPKKFRKPAPESFVALVKKADEIRTLYRSQYQKLKLTASFTIGESDLCSKAFDALPDTQKEDLQCAKHYYESLWQLAWKELYYAHPEYRDHDLTYNPKTLYILEFTPTNPNPVPLKK